MIKSLVLVALLGTLSSFSGTWGGDSYRIYVNGKLVMEEYVYNQKSVKNIQLNQQAVNDQVSVYYSHCGKVGSERKLTIRDGNDKVLNAIFGQAMGKLKGKGDPAVVRQALREKLDALK